MLEGDFKERDKIFEIAFSVVLFESAADAHVPDGVGWYFRNVTKARRPESKARKKQSRLKQRAAAESIPVRVPPPSHHVPYRSSRPEGPGGYAIARDRCPPASQEAVRHARQICHGHLHRRLQGTRLLKFNRFPKIFP